MKYLIYNCLIVRLAEFLFRFFFLLPFTLMNISYWFLPPQS